MKDPAPKMTFTKKETPILREKRSPGFTEATNVSFSDEIDHEAAHPQGRERKYFLLKDETNKIDIGHILYDYPLPSDQEMLIRIEESGIERNYQGQELGLKMYEHLIDIAKQKGLEGIKSDTAVQGGALTIWKKLQEAGHNVIVNEEVLEKWAEYLRTYEEGKYFKEVITTANKKDSIFKLILDQSNQPK